MILQNQDLQAGKFAEATEVERFEELKALIQAIKIPTVFKAEHVTLPAPIRGRLPEDRNEMVAFLDNLIEVAKKGAFDNYRSGVYSL